MTQTFAASDRQEPAERSPAPSYPAADNDIFADCRYALPVGEEPMLASSPPPVERPEKLPKDTVRPSKDAAADLAALIRDFHDAPGNVARNKVMDKMDELIQKEYARGGENTMKWLQRDVNHILSHPTGKEPAWNCTFGFRKSGDKQLLDIVYTIGIQEEETIHIRSLALTKAKDK